MNNVIVQIYEIQTPEQAVQMIDLGVDHIGSVLTSKQDWKNQSIKNTIEEVSKSHSKSCLIPLFHDEELVLKVLNFYKPDIVHFCDLIIHNNKVKKKIELQKCIKKKLPDILIMRSLPIPEKNSNNNIDIIGLAKLFLPYSDYFLTDTLILNNKGNIGKFQPIDGFIGITGKTCDWDIARDLVQNIDIPIILAGGIGPENVYEGIYNVHPAGVDSCTNTNITDQNGIPIRFIKDRTKVLNLIAKVREAERIFYK